MHNKISYSQHSVCVKCKTIS